MEYASLLAGERWSDHPRCTHPLLAGVARVVNDHVSDTARAGLVRLVPSVIGLTATDPRVDVVIAVRCAATALPVVSEHRQRALAVGLLAAIEVLDDLDEASSADTTGLSDLAEEALAGTPHAARWAEEFTSELEVRPRSFRKYSAPTIVRVAVVGIAEACIPDRDTMLCELLAAVIDDCSGWLGAGSAVPESQTLTAVGSPRTY